MSAADSWDEFDLIDRLFRPLADAAPEALGLRDDAALIPARPGQDLVVTTDTIVEGVHFLPSDPLDLVARKLLRVNLSDLAAKGAVPYGYFLNLAWRQEQARVRQELFAAGLARDQVSFGVKLFGGDTVSTPGPLSFGATMLGWTPAGSMVRRSEARAGDLVLVSGPIGDAHLGLSAAQAPIAGLAPWQNEYLALRYRLPTPRLDLRAGLSRVNAAADVSDGLLADAGRIATASGLGVEIELDRMPISPVAAAWLAGQADAAQAMLRLATGGDDYELVCAAPAEVPRFTAVGRFVERPGLTASWRGRPLDVAQAGFRHGNRA